MSLSSRERLLFQELVTREDLSQLAVYREKIRENSMCPVPGVETVEAAQREASLLSETVRPSQNNKQNRKQGW